MVWQLRERQGEFIKSLNKHVPCYSMVNDADVEIEHTGISFRDRYYFFVYRQKNLTFRFSASATYESQLWDNDQLNLGPVCEVLVFSHDLSRPVLPAEGLVVAETVTSFLLEFHRFPRADPPFPERVVFRDITRGALKLPG